MTICHQMQPTKKSCGQTCIAMLADTTAKRVLTLLPDKKGTTALQLTAVAALLGVQLDKLPVVRFRGEFPSDSLVLARIIWHEKRHRTHWIVVDTRPRTPCVYDPGLKERQNLFAYNVHLEQEHGRVMSFIHVIT